MSDAKSEKTRRRYRACIHCRSRKAKCDLGDIDSPSSPPCSRCKRESRECVFAPSRRGGNHRKRNQLSCEEDSRIDSNLSLLSGPSATENLTDDDYAQSFPPYPHPPAHSHRPSSESPLAHSPPSTVHERQGAYGALPSPVANVAGSRPTRGHSSLSNRQSYQPVSSGPTQSSISPSKRRRKHTDQALSASNPNSIVVANMQNESDALQILALASGQAAGREGGDEEEPFEQTRLYPVPESAVGIAGIPLSNHTGMPFKQSEPSSKFTLDSFPLIQMGIIDQEKTLMLAEAFFKCHHHFFPLIPSLVIPRTMEQLVTFARNEKHLLTTFIIIASRVHGTPEMREIHDRSWSVMRGWISKVQCFGGQPTIGLVESLLLLSENLPRFPHGLSNDLTESGIMEEPHGAENRQAWQLIGLAVRSAYELGLDKLGLQPIPEDAERTMELERATLAWAYCYLFDRHISIRLGKGFWTRGGAVCFQGYSSSAQTGPSAALANFPFFREIKASGPGDSSDDRSQEDLGSLVQAYLELSMLLSNCADCLYPSAARTKSLMAHGEYFKFLDEMSRSLEAFKILWEKKRWTLFSLTDTVWVMYYYVQLYICAFGFQAHVERATARGEKEYKVLQEQHRASGGTYKLARPPLSLFPRGAAQSADARYIFQMCDAARELIHICVDNLYPGGALPYLPSRFVLWFTYGAIVLLKAIYSGAMLRADHKVTLDLIDRLCVCFARCSTDEEFPAVRYGRQIEALRKKLAVLSNGSDPSSSVEQNTRSPRTGSHRREARPTEGVSTTHLTYDQDGQHHGESEPDPVSTWKPEGPSNHPPGDSTTWQFPATNQYPQPITFPYPAYSNSMASSRQDAPMAPVYVVPPQQPVMDFGADQTSRGQNLGIDKQNSNLGFATLDNWFGLNQGESSGGYGDSQIDSDPMGLTGVGIDLQDFWMNVGPGEARGGFPFR